MFGDNLFEEIQNVLSDPDHEENYWVNSKENGVFRCLLLVIIIRRENNERFFGFPFDKNRN